jgi:hypothetical protein
MQRSDEAMICVGKNSYISVISIAKPKNFVVFAFTYVLDSFVLLYDNFCMNPYSIESDKAMKRGDEAMKRWSDEAMKQGDEVLKASSLQSLRSVKCFIASIFFLALNASLPLLCKENHHLKLHWRYFLKEIHRLTLHRHYFLK